MGSRENFWRDYTRCTKEAGRGPTLYTTHDSNSARICAVADDGHLTSYTPFLPYLPICSGCYQTTRKCHTIYLHQGAHRLGRKRTFQPIFSMQIPSPLLLKFCRLALPQPSSSPTLMPGQILELKDIFGEMTGSVTSSEQVLAQFGDRVQLKDPDTYLFPTRGRRCARIFYSALLPLMLPFPRIFKSGDCHRYCAITIGSMIVDLKI
ncbi:hypothetical protein PILCRDRAFT_810038 [Piloderma croceum F 1598]|uniref:Uncharacterized protein n=1 Tax=Piloderma croceum (strain F 1598) TaxID=765440 RepID=A0A0C3GK95_PILCF|nr:hypothetical protein PILCRDRAFT_810038 [Piloderma croceum F 1598]